MGICLQACLYAVCPQGGQKRVLDRLELGSLMVVGCHVGAGIEPRLSARAGSALNLRAISLV